MSTNGNGTKVVGGVLVNEYGFVVGKASKARMAMPEGAQKIGRAVVDRYGFVISKPRKKETQQVPVAVPVIAANVEA